MKVLSLKIKLPYFTIIMRYSGHINLYHILQNWLFGHQVITYMLLNTKLSAMGSAEYGNWDELTEIPKLPILTLSAQP